MTRNTTQFEERFNNLPVVDKGLDKFTIFKARYAKDKVAISFPFDGMLKSNLITEFETFLNNGDFLFGKQAARAYSHREKAYIISISKIEKFLKWYKEN